MGDMNDIDDSGRIELDGRLLQALVAVHEEGSLTRAAQRLGLTQSAVSHAVERLRGITGDALFVRSGRGIVPTARADVLVAGARRLIAELRDFGQGFKDMAPAIDQFEAALLNRQVAHNGHPVLTWCMSNAVTDTDPAGNRKLNKAKAHGRIDLVVAAVMAYASAAADVEPTGPAWYDLNAA